MRKRKPLHPLLADAIRRHEKKVVDRFRRETRSFGVDHGPIPLGILTIVSTDALTGDILGIVSDLNIVVKKGRSALAHLLPGDDVANQKVVAMKFGDGGAAPTINDTDLSGNFIIQKSTTFDFPDSGGDDMKVRFTATVNANEGNGAGTQTYREACLVKGNGDIFSHKVTGAIDKTSDVILTATWTYLF